MSWREAPLIDAGQLEGYAELLEPAQVKALVNAFALELETRPALIGDLVAQGDFVGARIAAHRLKGASLTIGALRIAALADMIEHAEPEALPSLAEALPTCASETRATFGTIFDSF